MDRPDPSPDETSFARTLGDVDPSFVSLLRQVVGDWQQGPSGFAGNDDPQAEAGPAERIGRFEVIEVLGRGGYGTVLRVRDLKLGCERAMKVPNPETLASPRSLARFMDEARKAVMIDHPNVVRVLEADEVFSLCYMVMEYCPERSLAGWLARRPADRPVPPRWAAALVAEIADGVQQAHAAGLLHRDLKPGNVMLVRVGEPDDADPPAFRPKVGDFGLAKAMGDSPGRLERTASGAMIGTLAYMSPEQARGEKAIREGADIHGLGAILFELLTRSVPYAGSSEAEVLARILGDSPPPSPRALRPDLPRDLDIICRTALARNPGDRYATAAELADDLRRHLRNDAVKGSPWWKRARAGLRRHRSRAALLGLGVLLAAAVAGGLVYKDWKDASVWLTRLEAADIAEIPDLIAERGPRGPRVVERLNRLFAGDDPAKKLNAALMLAPTRVDCADYAYDRLLAARPQEIAPIARGLDGQMPGFLTRLKQDASKPSAGTGPLVSADDAEAHDRRRANTAAALVLLGRREEGLRLLKFDPDPQVRSILIHNLGPAGVAPRVLHDRLIDRGTEVSIRRALILALGEMPPSAWTGDELSRVGATVLDLFRNDPDSGIHGATKWWLNRWDRHADVVRIEGELKGQEPRAGFRWRVSRFGLTFVTIDDPETGRAIEVSDTEVPRDLFLGFLRDHKYPKEASTEPDCPILQIRLVVAAAFCNSLTDRDGMDRAQRCYGEPSLRSIETISGWLDHAGYRLPTDREFLLACRAGSKTVRYHGDSTSLLREYAWYDDGKGLRTHSVARLKPNELGLFDTLGNARELCETAGTPADPKSRAVFCGGSILNNDLSISSDHRSLPTGIDQRQGVDDIGFRVARTVRAGP